MLNEFKAFIARGNVVDLAVGIIMGAAFTAIVTSLVQDVIMPPIGWVMGGIDFSNFFFDPRLVVDSSITPFDSLKAAKDAGAPVIAYGEFLNAVIKFIIVSFAVFILVKQVNKLQAKLKLEAKKDDAVPADIALLTEIRDLLKK